ncbi:MAG: hypothetical protein OIN66_02330 [Candidatus Methanoperedens sp.]|nr:hypothetical protein [Candidatus Methanoperedens sp.]
MNYKAKVLTDLEAQNLFRKFAAPLFRAASSPARKKAAHELARMLWVALITGPDIEELVFQELVKVGLDAEGIQAIRDRYYREMKPAITEEELQALKISYKVKKE